MMNILIPFVTRLPAAVGTLLFGSTVANEAIPNVVTEITNITSLEMLVTIAGAAALQFAVVWAKRRFGITG